MVTHFNLRSTGDLMQRVQANCNLRDIISKGIIALLDSLLLLGYSTLMLLYHPPLGLLVISLSVLRLVIVSRFHDRQKQLTEIELLMMGKEQSVVVEALSAPEMIKALAAEQDLEQQHLSRAVERINAGLARERISSVISQCLTVFDGMTLALVLAVAGMAVLNDSMTVGVFAAFLTLQGLLQRPLSSIVDFTEREFHFEATDGILAPPAL